MSSIFYYSNYCEKCKSFLQTLSQTSMKDDIHFICLDNRTKKNNTTYVILSNGQEILLPHTVTKVPALLLLNQNHKVLFGDEIASYIEPKQMVHQNGQNISETEPNSFMLGGNSFGVTSDQFSFLDQTADEMTAKGDGGLRQQHHYSTLANDSHSINTPLDTYTADTIGQISMEELQAKRNNDIKN